jgi:archaeosortase A (PGF-CTERM-specific)
MGNTLKQSESKIIASLFIILPTLMLIAGYIIYPPPYVLDEVPIFIHILIVITLVLLGAGFFLNKKTIGKKLKVLGWMLFAFYWATQPAKLYITENEDIFNAVLCIVGVYVLAYIAYHEWLSYKRNEEISCLNWIAGASFIAGFIYFGIEITPLEVWLRQVVASHSGQFLALVTGETVVVGGFNNLYISYKDATIYLIFACTAVQAMVIFVGMILPLKKVDIKRKIIGLSITLIPIYILNFMRNAMVIFLMGNDIADFYLAHNVISKIGALITLIILLLIVIKIIPEILDEIFCLTDLRKRDGPLEKIFKNIIGEKK